MPLGRRAVFEYTVEELERSAHQHRELIAALRQGDPEWAEAVMRNHTLGSRAPCGADEMVAHGRLVSSLAAKRWGVLVFGYSGAWAEVDLTRRAVDLVELPESLVRDYLGGTGIGSRLLYDRVTPGVEWHDPQTAWYSHPVLWGDPGGRLGRFLAVTKER